ncbi:MAG: acyltransferase [Vulcanimicrobiaceae bacterium]
MTIETIAAPPSRATDQPARDPRVLVRLILRLAYKLRLALRLIAFDACGYGTRDGLVSIGSAVTFDRRMRVHFGASVVLGKGGIFEGAGHVAIGARTYVGPYFTFNAQDRIVVGADCMLANYVSVVDNAHGTDPGSPMREQPFVRSAVTVGDNCWLGEKVTVLSGVTIGPGCVIGAGAVVTRDIPPNSVAVGIPARVIRRLQ